MEIYKFHVGSFSWIISRLGENFAQSYAHGDIQLSCWNLEFWISWWISFIFWHVLMNCDLWHLNLTKKSKFDFSVYSWLLISWLKIHLSIHWTWAMFWTMLLGKNDAIGLLRSRLKPIDHFLGQKSEIALSQSKP